MFGEVGGREGQSEELGGDVVPQWERGEVLSISSPSPPLLSALWEPQSVSVMPLVLGAEGGVGNTWEIAGSINLLPGAALTVSQGGQQMPGNAEP